jgi:hypothetical protein
MFSIAFSVRFSKLDPIWGKTKNLRGPQTIYFEMDIDELIIYEICQLLRLGEDRGWSLVVTISTFSNFGGIFNRQNLSIKQIRARDGKIEVGHL